MSKKIELHGVVECAEKKALFKGFVINIYKGYVSG